MVSRNVIHGRSGAGAFAGRPFASKLGVLSGTRGARRGRVWIGRSHGDGPQPWGWDLPATDQIVTDQPVADAGHRPD